MFARLRAIAELARVSNLPTVWSNVLVGFTMGYFYTTQSWTPSQTILRHAWPMMVAMSLAYAGGMILNDVADAAVDAIERPGRPIPSGRIGRRLALVLAITCLGAALLALGMDYGRAVLPWGGALMVCIVAYNLLSKRTALSVLLMAACRALLPLTAAAAVGHWQNGLLVAWLLGGMTFLISLVARGEMQPGRRWHRGVAVVIALLPWVSVIFVSWNPKLMMLTLATALLLGPMVWLGRETPRAIGAWIAGMAILDAAILWAWGWPVLAALSLVAAGLTWIAQRAVRGS